MELIFIISSTLKVSPNGSAPLYSRLPALPLGILASFCEKESEVRIDKDGEEEETYGQEVLDADVQRARSRAVLQEARSDRHGVCHVGCVVKLGAERVHRWVALLDRHNARAKGLQNT